MCARTEQILGYAYYSSILLKYNTILHYSSRLFTLRKYSLPEFRSSRMTTTTTGVGKNFFRGILTANGVEFSSFPLLVAHGIRRQMQRAPPFWTDDFLIKASREEKDSSMHYVCSAPHRRRPKLPSKVRHALYSEFSMRRPTTQKLLLRLKPN